MPDAIIDGTGSAFSWAIESNNAGKVNIAPKHTDTTTNAVKCIDYPHNEIHSGDHYNIRNFTTLAASGNRITFGVTTPNTTKWAHMLFEIEGTTQTEVRTWEGATCSGGTAVTPFNNNRNSVDTSTLTIVSDPTISGATPTSGTLIESHSRGLEGATPAKSSSAGTAKREDEWILKSGTTYIWEIKSVGDDNIIDYSATWYEHTNK